MAAPVRSRLFSSTLLFALAGLDPVFGRRECGRCKEPTPKLDERGSYNCINCGDALFVDTPPPATTPATETR